MKQDISRTGTDEKIEFKCLVLESFMIGDSCARYIFISAWFAYDFRFSRSGFGLDGFFCACNRNRIYIYFEKKVFFKSCINIFKDETFIP